MALPINAPQLSQAAAEAGTAQIYPGLRIYKPNVYVIRYREYKMTQTIQFMALRYALENNIQLQQSHTVTFSEPQRKIHLKQQTRAHRQYL